MEARPDSLGWGEELGWQRRLQLEVGGGQSRTEPELDGRPGGAGEEDRFCLLRAQGGKAGAIAVDEPVAAGVPRHSVRGYARHLKGLDVAVDGPDRHLQVLGELGGGHLALVWSMSRIDGRRLDLTDTG